MIGAFMYFSESAATAPILFGDGRATRLAEDQVERHPEDGEHDAGGPEREGGATGEVAAAPERPDQEEEGAQHRQPVGGSAAPGQLRREDGAQAGQVHHADEGKRREQGVGGSSVEPRHTSPAAIGPPPITRSPSSKTPA